MPFNLKSAFTAAAIAAGAVLAFATPATATPAASGLASSGIAGIADGNSLVNEVRHRGRAHRRSIRRHRGQNRRWRRHRSSGPSIYFGLGAPYYYGNPYYYPRPRYRRYYGGGGNCARAHRACVARWGYPGSNYRGCMRYEGCRPR
jgi:hypothetical protein